VKIKSLISSCLKIVMNGLQVAVDVADAGNVAFTSMYTSFIK
jgi:hypothetical protein